MPTTLSPLPEEIKTRMKCRLLHTQIPIIQENGKIKWACKECTEEAMNGKK